MEAAVENSFISIECNRITTFIVAILIAISVYAFVKSATIAFQTHTDAVAVEHAMQWTSDTSSWKQNW